MCIALCGHERLGGKDNSKQAEELGAGASLAGSWAGSGAASSSNTPATLSLKAIAWL